MTAIEDIRYLQKQGRLVLDMNTRAILELYELMAQEQLVLQNLDESIKLIKNRLDLEADGDEPHAVTKSKKLPRS